MNIPKELKYSSDHEWVRVEGDVATIGITDFAQSQLGDIVFVDIQTEGETFDKDEVFTFGLDKKKVKLLIKTKFSEPSKQ